MTTRSAVLSHSTLVALRGSHGAVKPHTSTPTRGAIPVHGGEVRLLLAAGRIGERVVKTIGTAAAHVQTWWIYFARQCPNMHPKLHGPPRAAQIARSASIAASALAAAMLLDCSRADSQRVAASGPQGPTARQTAAALATGTVGGYHLRPPVASGRITGSIAFDGPAPSDSIVHPTIDTDVCGQTLVDPTVDHRGPLLANAVVWVDGVAAGKALPIARRYDITNVGCRIVPRIQAVIAGGTLDVLNADQTTHLTRFIQSSTGAVLATVPETEAGAVVPSRVVLASPGIVEVRCDVHPWAKAWMLVFDQPYFTTTNANGAFVIDSVPPGRYRVSVWHERFGTQRDSVTVAAGQDAVLNVTFRRRTLGD